MTATTLLDNGTTIPALLVALELSSKQWKLAFGFGRKERYVTVPGGDIAAVMKEIAVAKAKLKAPAETPVVSCYEAGRDGFWIHRDLVGRGVSNLVVDSASIKVDRRRKRAKTDGLDVRELLTRVRSHLLGLDKLKVCHVPDEEDEDIRHLRRQEEALKADLTRCSNRIKSLLVTMGVRMKVDEAFPAALEKVTTPLGKPLPTYLKLRLLQEHQQWTLLRKMLEEILNKQRELILDPDSRVGQMVQQLLMLCAIGSVSAFALVVEMFGWRGFTNRRQVGGFIGATPTPYNSGDSVREQGISKAGHASIRTLMHEIAWGWLRYQPDSALTTWFRRKYGGGKSNRKSGITALTRKLVIALWRYLDQGLVPEGAQFKRAVVL